ncbi:hypothetical protein VB735_34215 [Halotia wernerae UHCC 0503]|nr:hypothetical protein [Halotia wernerae UHCC 0503]
MCIDVMNTHDIKLARNLYSFLKPNDVLVGDRAFCAYADMFTIKKFNCDAVFRLRGRSLEWTNRLKNLFGG